MMEIKLYKHFVFKLKRSVYCNTTCFRWGFFYVTVKTMWLRPIKNLRLAFDCLVEIGDFCDKCDGEEGGRFSCYNCAGEELTEKAADCLNEILGE